MAFALVSWIADIFVLNCSTAGSLGCSITSEFPPPSNSIAVWAARPEGRLPIYAKWLGNFGSGFGDLGNWNLMLAKRFFLTFQNSLTLRASSSSLPYLPNSGDFCCHACLCHSTMLWLIRWVFVWALDGVAFFEFASEQTWVDTTLDRWVTLPVSLIGELCFEIRLADALGEFPFRDFLLKFSDGCGFRSPHSQPNLVAGRKAERWLCLLRMCRTVKWYSRKDLLQEEHLWRTCLRYSSNTS